MIAIITTDRPGAIARHRDRFKGLSRCRASGFDRENKVRGMLISHHVMFVSLSDMPLSGVIWDDFEPTDEQRSFVEQRITRQWKS